jgi:uncharacterized protein YceK
MKRICLAIALCFLFTGCSAVRLASVAGKAAKAGTASSKVAKASVAATKAGTATKVVGKGAAVAVVAHADDAVGLARLGDSVDGFRLVTSEVPIASGKTGVSTFSPKELEHLATGLDLADLVSSSWEFGEEYELGEGGPAVMKETLARYPLVALSPAMRVDDGQWAQWVARPEGERLCIFDPFRKKLAFFEPERRS